MVVNTDGSSASELTSNFDGPDNNGPAWALDGTKIAFVSQNDIHVIDLDGSNLLNLTNDPNSFDLDPAWSPAP